MDYKEKLEGFYDEMVESYLQEYCTEDPKRKDLRKNVVALSQKVELILKSLPEKDREIIDEYLGEKNTEHFYDVRYLYKQGFKDGIKFKKDFEM